MQFEKDIQFCSLLIFKRYESNMANYKWYGCYFFSLSFFSYIFSHSAAFSYYDPAKMQRQRRRRWRRPPFCMFHSCVFVFLLLSVEIKEIKTNVKIKNKSIFWSLIALKWFDNFYPSPPFSLLLSVRFIFIFILFVCLVHLFTLQRSSECTKTIQKQHIKWEASFWMKRKQWMSGRARAREIRDCFYDVLTNNKKLQIAWMLNFLVKKNNTHKESERAKERNQCSFGAIVFSFCIRFIS